MSAVIEYDVALVDRSQYAHSPLLVEVEKSPGSLLGINLVAENTTPKTNNQRGVVIESITSASIAERYSTFCFLIIFNFRRNRNSEMSTSHPGAGLCIQATRSWLLAMSG